MHRVYCPAGYADKSWETGLGRTPWPRSDAQAANATTRILARVYVLGRLAAKHEETGGDVVHPGPDKMLE